MALVARRVAFLESIWVTAAVSCLPVFMASRLSDLFTYGTATAYFALIILAGALIVLVCLTLGGSLGYLLAGDGRWVPTWSYEKWVGTRFLMGKRSSSAISIITILSVFAVMVGTSGMVVVMSVMNGFSSDLRSKILGANAHLIVQKYGKDFSEYPDILKKTRAVTGVTGASPFVLNEVMITSDVNLTGALIKGIEVTTWLRARWITWIILKKSWNGKSRARRALPGKPPTPKGRA
jgi:hypothetical protein